MESRIHDDKKENDVLKISGDPLDDYYDSERYGYLSWETHRQVKAPLNVRIEEQVSKLWDVDPTTAMHRAVKIIEEEKAKDAPGQYGGTMMRRKFQS
jgi:hypothetical protein